MAAILLPENGHDRATSGLRRKLSISYSPLRYPGGKSCIFAMTRDIVNSSQLRHCAYGEPFAGGCGLALRLLMDGVVSRIYINDLDPAIWAFWDSVLNGTEELCDRIARTDVTVEEWRNQRERLAKGLCDDAIGLGFAAFFLNRTNRSGIIKSGGVIGGIEQKGDYLIDCRYNKPELIRRISRIALHRDQIVLTHMDAVDFMDFFEARERSHCLLCIDPPYFSKGSSLYSNFYRKDDHAVLSDRVRSLEVPWIMTYDSADEIRDLYADFPAYHFSINYSAQSKRLGTELLIHSGAVEIPENLMTSLLAA